MQWPRPHLCVPTHLEPPARPPCRQSVRFTILIGAHPWSSCTRGGLVLRSLLSISFAPRVVSTNTIAGKALSRDRIPSDTSRAVYKTNRRSPMEPFYPRRARPPLAPLHLLCPSSCLDQHCCSDQHHCRHSTGLLPTLHVRFTILIGAHLWSPFT